MPTMTAIVPTADAGRLINRLCKHFNHKVEAHWTGNTGQVIFAIGECHMTATPEALELSCRSPSQAELDELGQVVASHLVRFAGGEVEVVEWQAPAAHR
ncbi:MAG: DUF2218 domain-containing protein [Pseudomonadota bacterium]